MRKLLLLTLLILLPLDNVPAEHRLLGSSEMGYSDDCRRLYDDMALGGIVDYNAFECAYEGYCKIQNRRKEIITLIDFTKPSTEERLYVIDMRHKAILFKSHVSHGRNSGGKYATSFSNENGSHKSSLGFYLTANTYQGRNGYSLALDGLEKGINDKARERAIVIHGADYANPSLIGNGGRLGRSLGCPALPQQVNAHIIDVIKGGSVLFIYADDNSYLNNSNLLAHSLGQVH